MSEGQLKALLAKLKEDASLREKVQRATSSDNVVSIAHEEGFEIALDETLTMLAELSDFDLENVAGGNGTRKPGFCRTNVASWEDLDAGKQCAGGC